MHGLLKLETYENWQVCIIFNLIWFLPIFPNEYKLPEEYEAEGEKQGQQLNTYLWQHTSSECF